MMGQEVVVYVQRGVSIGKHIMLLNDALFAATDV